MGPPKRTMDMEIFFDRGVDNYGSWLKVMKEHKIVKQGGAWYKYVDTDTGEEHKYQAKDFAQLLEDNQSLKPQMYEKICEKMVLEYHVDTSDPTKLTHVDPDEQVLDD